MRHEREVVIDAEGRDKGKTYLITEMPAERGEKWAIRVGLELLAAGVSLPADGMAGLAAVGLGAFRFKGGSAYFREAIEPLLDEMFACVQHVPDPKEHPEIKRRPIPDVDIEEVGTRLTLRLEVLALHLGFSAGDVLSKASTMAAPRPGA